MTDLDLFEAERPRLFSIAYRMMGERAGAEDIVQDAWLKWQSAKTSDLKSPQAWLTTVTTRLAIDALKSARTRRESYVGPWLPEPLIDEDRATPEEDIARTQQVELALLYVLERLVPEERAAYLLRESFDTDYADLANMLDKSEDAVRQLVSRAKKRLGEGPRTTASFAETRALLERFLAATLSKNKDEMIALLAPDVVLVSDGGGKVGAALRVLEGIDDAGTVWWAVTEKQPPPVRVDWVRANGAPALLIEGEDETTTLLTLVPSSNGRAGFIYAMRNPDKLAA